MSAAPPQEPTDVVTVEVEAWQGAACVGTVIDVGAQARALVGARVLVGSHDACGECEVCRAGGATVCPHAKPRVIGKQTHAVGRWVVVLGDGLDLPLPAAAAVAGDIALAYTMYARTNLAPRDPAVIVGESAVARFLVEILRAKGITPTVVADPEHVGWCEWLRAKGAGIAAVAPTASATETRDAITAVFAAQGVGARPWRVLAVRGEAARASALPGPRATLTVLAPAGSIDPDLVTREVTVIGVARAHPDLIVEVAAMCVKGDIDLSAGTTRDELARTCAVIQGP